MKQTIKVYALCILCALFAYGMMIILIGVMLWIQHTVLGVLS